MTKKFRIVASLITILGPLCLAAIAHAQSSTGTIAGTVKDSSGAPVPGVTVEVVSPALIEKVRVAVTDGGGEYKIVELRPGTYTVTFTLAGFSTFKREGIELTSGFTASVNAELAIGPVEETITVSGASPTVDTQNTRSQTVFSREVQDTLPTAKTQRAFSALTLGANLPPASQDVGGDKSDTALGAFKVHGGPTLVASVDGMIFDGFSNGGTTAFANNTSVVEVTVVTRGGTADQESGGVLINNVPRDGGNTFSSTFGINGANSGMQSTRLTDELRARGVTSGADIKQAWDIGFGVGGPFKRDKLWFYATSHWWGAQMYAPGAYFPNKTDPAARGGLLWLPDLSRPAYRDVPQSDYSTRLTWQVAQKHKASAYISYQRNCDCWVAVSATRTPDYSAHLHFEPLLGQAKWTYTASNRLLFEGGVSGVYHYNYSPRPNDVSPTAVPVTELSNGMSYNAVGGTIGPNFTAYGTFYNNRLQSVGSMAYVTGAHAVKFGIQLLQGWRDYSYDAPAMEYQFRSSTPCSTSLPCLSAAPAAIREWAMPMAYKTKQHSLGIYAQDQWKVRNLTLNFGVRFDYLNGSNSAVDLAAGPFVPARNFPGNSNVPNWKDVSPRLGVAYDPFGDGKTAIKVSLNRYVVPDDFALTRANNPAYLIATSATRSWNDRDGNFVPDCILSNPMENGECGTIDNLNLGKTVPSLRYDSLTGSFVRQNNWQTDVTAQHELSRRVAVMAGYYRTWYGNLMIRDNEAVTAGDFDPFCITVPVDPRLPGGGGSQLCGLYNVNPVKFGQSSEVLKHGSDFAGTMSSVTTGFDVGIRARFGQDGLIQGGFASDRDVITTCLEGLGASPMAPTGATGTIGATLPGTLTRTLPVNQCKLTNPFSKQLQVKFSGAYSLPWGLLTSAVFQNLPGPSILATYNVPGALIEPSLGRVLSGRAATQAIDLIEPYTQYEKRFTQVDLRLAKILKLGRMRLQANVDLYNAFNSRTILAVNTTYAPNSSAWRSPTTILGGRLLKFGAQVDF